VRQLRPSQYTAAPAKLFLVGLPSASTSLMFSILIASPHQGQVVSGKGESVLPGV